jgi:antitoxin component of RelBE/YafQ-DinJ toxin-antitoxin module
MSDSILRMKSEDKISENDETMKKLKELEKKTQTNIDYLERALNILQNFGFTVKNSIDVFKLNFEH